MGVVMGPFRATPAWRVIWMVSGGQGRAAQGDLGRPRLAHLPLDLHAVAWMACWATWAISGPMPSPGISTAL